MFQSQQGSLPTHTEKRRETCNRPTTRQNTEIAHSQRRWGWPFCFFGSLPIPFHSIPSHPIHPFHPSIRTHILSLSLFFFFSIFLASLFLFFLSFFFFFRLDLLPFRRHFCLKLGRYLLLAGIEEKKKNWTRPDRSVFFFFLTPPPLTAGLTGWTGRGWRIRITSVTGVNRIGQRVWVREEKGEKPPPL